MYKYEKDALHELTNKKVVESNDLVTSVAKMKTIPLKIFELAVSQIDTKNPPADRTVYLSKNVLFSFFSVDNTGKYTQFRKALIDLHKESTFEVVEELENGEFEDTIVSPIEKTKWNTSKRDDRVSIQFTSAIMPYLIHLRTNFTQYAIRDISGLDSKYSIVLYKWISMNYNQFETYNGTFKRTYKQIESLKNPYIAIDELRKMTDSTDTYHRMYDFEKNILKVAKQEISENTHFRITYEKIKSGRSISGIKFYVEKRLSAPSNRYKENDEVYQKNIILNAAEKENLFSKAVKSKYTTLLGENLLIDFKSMQEVELMAELQSYVYPLYDRLKEIKGMQQVEQHIKYVATHQNGASSDKLNIAKYLKVSIEKYLNTVKLEEELKALK